MNIKLVVNAALPSWNSVLAMGFRKRHRLKHAIQDSLLSELLVLGGDSWTRTTCAKNTTSTPADMLASYILTHRKKPTSKSARSRFPKAKPNAQKLKS